MAEEKDKEIKEETEVAKKSEEVTNKEKKVESKDLPPEVQAKLDKLAKYEQAELEKLTAEFGEAHIETVKSIINLVGEEKFRELLDSLNSPEIEEMSDEDKQEAEEKENNRKKESEEDSEKEEEAPKKKALSGIVY